MLTVRSVRVSRWGHALTPGVLQLDSVKLDPSVQRRGGRRAPAAAAASRVPTPALARRRPPLPAQVAGAVCRARAHDRGADHAV